MSYTPSIIISIEDLEAMELHINFEEHEEGFEDAYNELEKAFKQKPIEFMGIKFIIIQPELSSRSSDVRKLLEKLKIRFTTDY